MFDSSGILGVLPKLKSRADQRPNAVFPTLLQRPSAALSAPEFNVLNNSIGYEEIARVPGNVAVVSTPAPPGGLVSRIIPHPEEARH